MASSQLEILTSRHFTSWLQQHQVSVAFTTYQLGKLFILGLHPDQRLHVTERSFSRCMGLGVNDDSLWISSLYQLWCLRNSLLPGQQYQDYDKVLIPQVAYTTGDLDIHDITVGADQTCYFVNTRFSCLATQSETHSFKMYWKPSFISRLVPEDRCHLNGMAAVNGKPRYVSLVGVSDVADGWREHRQRGGAIIDIDTDEHVCENLSMPHSPRWHQEKLWLLEAGTGHLGYVDQKTGTLERVTFCPGFLRGLCFIGQYAIVGSSGLRSNKTFSGLALDEHLKAKGAEARCGLYIVNIETGNIDHWVRAEGAIEELYDVAILKNTRKPLLIGIQKEEIQHMISIENQNHTQ